jgi:hypothetical protein
MTFTSWQEPMLPLYPPRERVNEPGVKRRLYLIPSHFGERYESEFAPAPTPQSDLPEIRLWVKTFVLRMIEIMSMRRSPQQLARWCHRTTFNQLLTLTKLFETSARIRRVYIRQPLESLAEVTVTVESAGRVTALVLRFEGVDKRWLCTVIEPLRSEN